MPDGKSIRAFLAIDPPEEVLRQIGSHQERLKRKIQGTISWVRPRGIHLTLKFFGDIAPADVERISRIVEPLAMGTSPLRIEVRKMGVFPGSSRPRVLWMGMEGDIHPLIVLQKSIEAALEAEGFPREDRPFRPHLTLGRIKTPRGLAGLAGAMEEAAEWTAGGFVARDLCLFQSDLLPQGAVYTKLASWPFGKERRRDDS
ncbi:MAG TPA: RNA 2',3'-cyclic phosphodiesterase [Syntrophales bacterium]|nr:RNA 2',3'-cyclic phosphodiesterase [Syntrophales bacterium]